MIEWHDDDPEPRSHNTWTDEAARAMHELIFPYWQKLSVTRPLDDPVRRAASAFVAALEKNGKRRRGH